MSPQTAAKGRAVSKAEITVEGKRYSIACAPGQEERLQALGVRLNNRVNKIKGAVGDVGEARLLLITALALIDELDAAKSNNPNTVAAANNLLLDAAARIDAIATRIESAK